jgi:hypothetical protein
MQLFEYAVILGEKRDKDGEITEEASIVVQPTTTLARDEGQAQMLAARAIPDELVNDGKLDRLTVVVRPFDRGEEPGLVGAERRNRGMGNLPDDSGWDATRMLGKGVLPQQWQASGTTPSFVTTTNSTGSSVYAAASSLLNKS